MSTSGEPASSRQTRLGFTHETEEATASWIYGIIVTSAVMAASHAPTALATDLAVLVTLVIYWAAERYARIIAERIHEGHRPSWDTVREQLTSGWEMVTASALPLVVLSLTRVLGAAQQTAVYAGLACSTALLCVAGWRVGAGGRLTRPEQLASTVIAGIFGASMIVLKTLLH